MVSGETKDQLPDDSSGKGNVGNDMVGRAVGVDCVVLASQDGIDRADDLGEVSEIDTKRLDN